MISPLRCGVDTLEVTFAGKLTKDFVCGMLDKKTLAQGSDTPEEVMLGGEMFYLQPKGRGFYSLVCRNQDMEVLFGSAGLRYPMSVRFSAYGLARRGVDSLWRLARQIASDVSCSPHNVSRVDVALDFQGWVPTFDEMRNTVCKADFRPVYPSADNPQTFQFGKGDVVVRVYDKTQQARDCDKGWWVFIWRICPGYDATLPIWRVEVQVRGTVLKELGLSSPTLLFEHLNDVFDYGMRWASLRVPGSDSNLSRCPEKPEWEALRCSQPRSEPLPRVRQARRLAVYDSLVTRQRSLVVSAALVLETDDFWGAARQLTEDANLSIVPIRADEDDADKSRTAADRRGFQKLLADRRRKLSDEF